MANIIGEAHEFWRVRLMRMDESGEPDLEWRDDILYRTPPQSADRSEAVFRIDAVSLDGQERVVPVAEFADSDTARNYIDQMEQDLAEMTRSQFERAYLAGADAPVEK